MKRLLMGLVTLAFFIPVHGFICGIGAEPIRFGILYDASGGASEYSAYNVKNVTLAIEEINAEGGILGRPVELLKEDDGNDPNVAPLRTRNLIKRGAVGLIFGSGSASAIQARVVAEEQRVPAISNNFHDRIAQPPNNSYVFQVQNSAAQQLDVLVTGIKGKYKQIAIFTDTGPTGAGLANLYKKALENAGVEVIATEAVDLGATDATAQVTRLRDKWKAKAVLISGQASQEQALFVRTVREIGWNVELFQDITAITASYRKLLSPKALENLVHVQQFHPSNELAQKWFRKFTEKYPNDPINYTAGAAWDCVFLLKNGIETARTTDGPALRDAIERTSNMKSHFGPPGNTVSCSKQNHLCANPGGAFLATFKNGKSVPVQK